MTALDRYSLSDRYTENEGRVFLTGIQALARLPIGQLRNDRADGLNTAAFVSGYQGSPLGGLDQELTRAIAGVPGLPIVARPAVNEELGATAVMGSQLTSTQSDIRYDGVVGYWYGKAPGLDRATDAIRHANFAGTSQTGGAVALVGDDPASKSSTLPSSSDLALMDLKLPMLYPGDVQEILDLGHHAVAISRLSGLWSSMKIVTAVADGSGSADIGLDRVIPIVPDLKVNGRVHRPRVDGGLIAPKTNELDREIEEMRLVVARRYGVANALNRSTADPAEAWLGIVAAGYTYREMLEALRRLGLPSLDAIAAAGIRLLHLRMPFPLDRDIVRRFARGVGEVVVVEEKQSIVEWMVKDALYGAADQPVVSGKSDRRGRPLIPAHGFLSADELVPALHRLLDPRLGARLAKPSPPPRERNLIPLTVERSPYFCSGCPHNWGTKSADGALIGAGIGCSGMALLMDEDKVGDIAGITCMGTEGSQWLGMEPFLERAHFVQNLGDGTLFHSGQLAIQAAVAAGANMTYKVLFNGTVAMTGGQDATGGMGVKDLTRVLLSYGVSEVMVTTDDLSAYDDADLPTSRHGGKTKIWDRTRIVEAQEYLATVPGVTVLIHDQACAAQTRRQRKRGQAAKPIHRVAINHRICEACGDCGEVSNCLSVRSVDTPLGAKTSIDQTSCNLDYSCVEGDCPSFMMIEPGPDSHDAAAVLSDAGYELLSPFPQPVFAAGERVNIRLAGIGGTGVVTASQILGTAAFLDGWQVRGLDQTGLSQKAGPVVSDLRLTRDRPAESNLVGAADADVIVGFDLLVLASDRVLNAGCSDRTVVVASSSQTQTGDMVGDPDHPYPSAETLMARAAGASRADCNRLVDAAAITTEILGDGAAANVFLLGVAVQTGAVPVAPEAIERAIDLNGVAVGPNQEAFAWGRQWVVDPQSVPSPPSRPGESGSSGQADVLVGRLPADLASRIADLRLAEELERLISLLSADLVGYQNAAYAERYLDFMTRVVGAERFVTPDSIRLTEAVGRGLHKLMAYKDEYEVARLLLGPEAQATAEAVGGRGAKVLWQLQPPILRSRGLDRKIAVDSRWGGPLMSLLVKARRFRGTALDPFGRSELRRAERSLIGQYTRAIDLALRDLSVTNLDAAVELARSAMAVRGYEQLKLERIALFRARLEQAATAGVR